MILAFTLSMPRCGSWNGRWSGEGKQYVVIRSFTGKKHVANAEKIRDRGYYQYRWSDGWAAGISVEEVNAKEAASLRRASAGFCGYDWMVDTIIQYGQPMASDEVNKYLSTVPLGGE